MWHEGTLSLPMNNREALCLPPCREAAHPLSVPLCVLCVTFSPIDADWVNLSDEELLERKISQLGLTLEGTELEPLIKQLYDELTAKGLAFHPPCHIGDEWFVPVGIPAIFIPFYLVHERLRRLELKLILEVEGGTPEWRSEEHTSELQSQSNL